MLVPSHQTYPGKPGIPGVPGFDGTDGDMGEKGQKGDAGFKGEKGQDGDPGDDGNDGDSVSYIGHQCTSPNSIEPVNKLIVNLLCRVLLVVLVYLVPKEMLE